MTFVVDIKPFEFKLNDNITIYCNHLKSSESDLLYVKAKELETDEEFITELLLTIGFTKEHEIKKQLDNSIIDLFEKTDFERFAILYARLRLSEISMSEDSESDSKSRKLLKDLFVKNIDEMKVAYQEAFDKVLSSTKSLTALNSSQYHSSFKSFSDEANKINRNLSGNGALTFGLSPLEDAALRATADTIKATKILREATALSRERVENYVPPPFIRSESTFDYIGETNRLLREQIEQSRHDSLLLQAQINVSETMANQLIAYQDIALDNSEDAERVAKNSIQIAILALIVSIVASFFSIHLTEKSIDVAIQIGKDSPSEKTLKTYIETISNHSAIDRKLWSDALKESTTAKKESQPKKANNRIEK